MTAVWKRSSWLVISYQVELNWPEQFQCYQEKNRHGKSTKDIFLNKLFYTQKHSKYVFRWFMYLKFRHHIILKPSCVCQAKDWDFVSSLNISTVYYPNLPRFEQSGQRFSTTSNCSFSHAKRSALHNHFPISQETAKAAQKWQQEPASATLHRNKKRLSGKACKIHWMAFSLDHLHPSSSTQHQYYF